MSAVDAPPCAGPSRDVYASVCERPAVSVVVYRNGSYGPFEAPCCAKCLAPVLGAAFPGVIEIREVAS